MTCLEGSKTLLGLAWDIAGKIAAFDFYGYGEIEKKKKKKIEGNLKLISLPAALGG